MYLSIYPSIYLSLCLSVYLCTCLSASLKTKLFCETSSFFELDNIKNAAILRDFFIFLNLTTSKRKQFCETSSIFEFDNIKNKAILRDFLSKVLRLPRKNDARSYEVLHLSRKIILANLQIWCSKMQPFSGNQRPATCLLYCACHAKCIFADPLQRSTPAIVLGNATKPSRFAHSWEGAQSLAPATTSERPKVLRTPQIFALLTSKCALFLIATSKSGPKLVCFVHFDFKMFFAPQWRALFRHRNF